MKELKIVALVLGLAWLAGPAEAQGQSGKPKAPKPVIASFSPTTGAPGTKVDLTGKNFSAAYTVWLGTTKVKVLSVTIDKLSVEIPDNAKTGRFVLKGDYIVESSGLFSVVEKKAPPKIDGFTPVTGSPGTEVTITGSNFSTQTFENTVMLGNAQVPVKSASPGQLIVVIPKEGVTGTFSITVAGGGTVTGGSDFVVAKALQITGFSPEAGPPGTQVTLFGSAFGTNKKVVTVSLGGKSAKVLSVADDKILVEVPADAISSSFLLELKGKPKVVSAKNFVVKVPPQLTSFTPAEGYPGTVVTLSGLAFGSSDLKTKVKLGEKVVKILSVTDNKIEVQIPKDASTDKFTVTITDRGSSTAQSMFTVWVPLALSSFSPEKGEVGTIVAIKGTGFLPDVKKVAVTLGKQKLQILGLTPTEISVKIPAGAASGKLVVDVKGRGTLETASPYTVVIPPVVLKFTPTSGQVGQVVTIQGKNFGFSVDNIRVWVGPDKTKQFCIVQQITADKVTCTVQPGTPTGPVTLAVKDMGQVTSKETFTVEEPLVLTGFSPASGFPGTSVTITGTGFSADAKKNVVKIGKTALKVVSCLPNQLAVLIPPTLKSGGSFTVQVKGRSGSAVSASAFDLIIPAKVKKISPKGGPIGTTVKLIGEGFGSDLQMIQVTLLGFYCPVVSLTPTEVQIQIPPGLVPDQSQGAFQLVVNPGGIAESPVAFKVTSTHPKGKAKPKP